MAKKVYLGKYTLGGGMGSWAKSYERGVEKGEVRVIGGVLMYAYSIYFRGLLPKEINWVPVDDKSNSWEQMSKWITNL